MPPGAFFRYGMALTDYLNYEIYRRNSAQRREYVGVKILVVGWDVAFSENGPVIIEGNRRPGFDLVQMTDGRGRMDMVRDLTERTKDRT